MKHIFHNKRISSIITILPSKIVRYTDELSNYPFPERQSQRLGQLMNYDTRRVCDDMDAISDYAIEGILHLFQQGVIKKEEIDGIIVVSSSQDHILPPVSYIIQGKLGLSSNVYCCDISQACAGYVYGLMQSFMVLDTLHLKKILLVTHGATARVINTYFNGLSKDGYIERIPIDNCTIKEFEYSI